MRALKYIYALVAVVVLVSCSPQFYEQATYDTDDMYATHSVEEILQERQRRREAAAEIFTEARYSEWNNTVVYLPPVRWRFGVGYGAAPYGRYRYSAYPYYGWSYGWNYGWGHNWGFTWGYGWGYDPFFNPYFSGWWGYPYWGFGYPAYYYRPYYHRPYFTRGGRSIVRPASRSIVPSSGGVKRRLDGSTVGRTTGTTYNRGVSSSSSYSTGGGTSTRIQSPSSSSSTSGGSISSGKLNSIGR